MPQVDSIEGVKIYVYNGEHRPPHIHARYNEFEILILIENAQVYAGSMPGKQLKTVYDWLRNNVDYALLVFYELNPLLK